MSSSQYVSVREAAQILGINEKKIMDMIEAHHLQAYRIADQFLRLKRAEVLQMRNSGEVSNETVQFTYTKAERIRDFFYFNDFYIIAILIILGLLYVILIMP